MTINKRLQYFFLTLLSGIFLALASPVLALEPNCYQRVNNTQQKLLSCMTTGGLIQHLQAFQQHADNNTELPGTRFSATLGYDASRDYIVNKMQQAGYQVSLQDVPIEVSYIKTPHVFEQVLPNKKTYINHQDYTAFISSGEGDVTARIESPSGDQFGCHEKDFAGFTSGNIALIKMSKTCSVGDKARAAIKAGASAIIIYNDAPGVFVTSMGSPIPSINTPAIFASLELGETFLAAMSQGQTPVVHIQFKLIKKSTISQNIIAESVSGNPHHVVMVGAHLDSSPASSGMNDNASAAAAVLETALLMQKVSPTNKLRFTWWTGEELGLVGSKYYVEHLSREDKANIALYLNYEMLGAVNGGRFIMGTADGVTSPGSEKITQLYVDYFNAQGLKSFVIDPFLFNAIARSDMFYFMQAGIPTGFLVTGAELPWTPYFDAIFTDLAKRTIGLATHPCYHRACDKLTLNKETMTDPNFDFDLYLQMSKAVAFATYTYAMKV